MVAGILIFMPITKSKRRTRSRTIIVSLDLVGFAIFAPASIQFFLALQYGGAQYAWDSATVIGLFCGSGVTFAIFLLWEYHKGEDAMIPLPMLRRRIVWSTSATMLFVTGILICGAYYLPIYFQAIKNTSPVMSGVYVLPNICSQIMMSMVAGILGTSESILLELPSCL